MTAYGAPRADRTGGCPGGTHPGGEFHRPTVHAPHVSEFSVPARLTARPPCSPSRVPSGYRRDVLVIFAAVGAFGHTIPLP